MTNEPNNEQQVWLDTINEAMKIGFKHCPIFEPERNYHLAKEYIRTYYTYNK